MQQIGKIFTSLALSASLIGCLVDDETQIQAMVNDDGELLGNWDKSANAEAAPSAGAPAGSVACFEQSEPRWGVMRSMVDEFVREGTISKEKAAAYKCDPRLVSKDMPVTIVVDEIPASLAQILPSGCKSTGTITVNIGSPTALVFRQSLEWCYNGNIVSDWGGQCTGWVTTWGWANFWKVLRDLVWARNYLPIPAG